MQLIQTTSILIQNIEKEQDSFYLLSHPFLNKLISYNFDLSGHNEIVDYFISFLKMLALKINKNSIQFFYNKRFKNFPLYGTAVNLYNHSESMVRTAARTITLTIFSTRDPDLIDAVLSLPHASYFPHLAWELRDMWIKVDQNIISDLDVDDLKDDIEDINDLLMYFQDIFNANISSLTIALSNSLLYYAYFPSIIGSLGWMNKNPDINSYSASIYFLNQTYQLIKEPLFINALSWGLFMASIPGEFSQWIENVIKPPATYKKRYSRAVIESDFAKYLEENLSKINIEGFINADYVFLTPLQDEYQKLKESREEEEIDDTLDNSDKNQIDAVELAIKRLKSADFARIRANHLVLSIAIGRKVGVWEKEAEYNYFSPTHYSEAILDSIYNGNYRIYINENEFVTNKYSKTLLNFLRSKDDSLLLLIGSLLYWFTLSDIVDPAILYESNLYPIGNRKKSHLLNSLLDSDNWNSKPSKLNFEEEKTLISGSLRDRYEYERKILETTKTRVYDDRIVNMLLDLLKVDPPFRPVTFRFLAVITWNLWYNKNLTEWMSLKQYDMLIEAFLTSIKHIK